MTSQTQMTQTPRQPKTELKLSAMVQPHFYTFWRTKRPYSILLGGRGSFKSSTTALKLVSKVKRMAQAGHKANVIVVRENANNLRDSVYNQIIWAITQLHMTAEFDYRVSPMTITHKRTGSTFYFYGADKPEKLKSNTVGNIIAVWYEEAANFKGPEVFDQSNPTFIRQKSPYVDHVEVIWTYNPPKNPYDWINEWVDSVRGDSDYLVDKSTYLDDALGFTTKQQLDLIAKYKDNDYDYYSWLYLGKEIGLGTTIYNMDLFHPIKELPSDDPLSCLFTSIDVGHMQSATACSVYGLTAKGKVILLDTYYYSPAGQSVKKAPSELSPEVHAFIDGVLKQYPRVKLVNMTIDSAEGALRNQYYHDYGIRWHPVSKKDEATMIDFVQSLLAQGRFYYLDTPNNAVFIDEHRRYQWDEKTMESDNPKVVKKDDHTVDGFKYMVMDNADRLRLKG
ncbi:PBSX family phage terminase large subunit [Lacticaseibacillus songhuajiangensis]|uniref:PBSX family phage terminase large subunit n=1 Tax=Lacticaseibacillus songhuajiangensis TaxID=1296539 RepID=UPI001CDB9F89|nr:PBSX family phage terminase large subunit [Lacticaseibacillus songhuajiangensis]